ncbi:MAG: response regulator [Sandaracinaceae bacterium]|nr:MAG: response regulator [Sandaracinaceae bacterium]
MGQRGQDISRGWPAWLRPPRHADPERARRVMIAWITFGVMFGATLAYTAIVAFVRPAQLTLPSLWVFFVITGGGLLAVRLGKDELAGWMLPLGLLAVGVYECSLGGDPFHNTTVFVFPIMILAAALLIGTRGALAFGAIGVLVGAGYYAASAQGWLTGPGLPNSVASYGLGFVITLVLLTLYTAFGARGVDSARESERLKGRALEQAHEALAVRALRGEALASLGRDVAEGIGAQALRQNAVERVQALLSARDVWWVEKTDGLGWSLHASVRRDAPEEVSSTLLDASQRLGEAVLGDGTTRDQHLGPGGSIAVAVPLEAGMAGMLARFEPDDAPTDDDTELVEAVAHLVTTALRHRNAADAALSGQRELVEMVEGSPDAILTVDPSSRVAMANPAAALLFGREPHEIIGRTLEELGLDLEGDAEPGIDDEEERLSEVALTTFRIERPDGLTREAEVNLRTTDLPDRGRCLQLVVRDITARRKAQRERRELTAKLAASQRMEALGKLAGGVAHDFNNLLTILMNLRELLAEEPLTDSARELVDDMGDLSDRAAGLTRQLLTFARKRGGRARRVDVGQVVRGLEPLLNRLVGDAVELSLESQDEAFARVDPSQLEQVVMNLAVNARDAMPSGGTLTVRVATVRRLDPSVSVTGSMVGAGPTVVLEVRDSGVGMDPETAARIFEPFFTTKGQDKGTGLGLSTVHGIVRRAGGNVEVDTQPGRGTTFRVVLPVDASEEAPKTRRRSSSDSGSRLRAAGVLVVEDEPLVRRTFCRALRHAKIRVIEAASAAEALRLLREDPTVALLLTDVSLPDSDGVALAEAALAERPELSVVYTSGHGSATLRELGIDPGRDRVIAKPFVPEEMVETVRRAMGGGAVIPLRRTVDRR